MGTTRRCMIAALGLILAVSGCKDKTAEATGPIAAKPGPVGPPAAVEVPTQVVAWAVAGNPALLLQNAEALAGKASPVPQGALTMGISQTLIKLGVKDTSVLDLSGPAGLMVLDGNKHKDPMLIAVTTKGDKAVLAALEPAWTHKGTKDGVQAFSRQVVDPYAVFKGGGEAGAKTIEQELFIKFEGKTTLVATERGSLADGGPALLERLRAGAPAEGLTGGLHVNHLRDTLAVQLSMAPQMLKQQISYAITHPGPQAVAPDKETTEWLVGWTVDKLFAFVGQTRHIGLAIGLSKDEAKFHLTITPEPNTFFAKLLAEQKPAKLGLTAGLPADSFLAMGIDVQWAFMKPDMQAFSVELLKRLTSKEASPELKALFKEWLEVTGDEMAIAEDMDATGGLRMVELIRVTDDERARVAIHKLMAMAGEWYGEDGIMGIRATVEGPTPLGEHDGVKLEKTVFKMDLSSLPEAQAKMVRQTYGGEGMVIVTAVFDKVFALTFGKGAEAELKAAIDRLRKGGAGLAASPEFKDASGGLEKGAGGYAYISLSKFIASTLRSTMAMTGGQAPDLKLPPAKSGMFWRTRSEGGRLINTIRLPATHLEEIGKVIQAITQMQTGG